MPTEWPPEDGPHALRLLQMESSIEAINTRIARVAIALGVSLKSEDEVARAINQPAGQALLHERLGTPERREASRECAAPDRRVAHMHEELRGLMVLRYGVETRFVEEVGVVATRQILVEAEAHMVRAGFKPGADGLNLERLFKEI